VHAECLSHQVDDLKPAESASEQFSEEDEEEYIPVPVPAARTAGVNVHTDVPAARTAGAAAATAAATATAAAAAAATAAAAAATAAAAPDGMASRSLKRPHGAEAALNTARPLKRPLGGSATAAAAGLRAVLSASGASGGAASGGGGSSPYSPRAPPPNSAVGLSAYTHAPVLFTTLERAVAGSAIELGSDEAAIERRVAQAIHNVRAIVAQCEQAEQQA